MTDKIRSLELLDITILRYNPQRKIRNNIKNKDGYLKKGHASIMD